MADVSPQGFDLSSLLQGAQSLMSAQAAATQLEHTGTAGGGKVSVTVTGGGDVLAVSIAAEVVDPSDVSLLEDLVLAAVRDAMNKVQHAQADALGGFDLGALGGMLGVGAGADDDGADDEGDEPDGTD